ncbi:MAG: putative metal-dependent hydrolase [Spirochaetia bacterium]|nr:putative metal-dependent hydrolase [Spirochaetia bacterium]
MSVDPKFPAGRYQKPDSLKATDVAHYIDQIATLPEELHHVVSRLTPDQFQTKTLPGVWTVAQVIHHIADSHMNSFARIKLALTEPNPVIKPYNETAWALLADASESPADESVTLIDALHKRWVRLLRTLDDAALERTFVHPEYNRTISVGEQIPLYAWHGRHHLGHIQALISEKGW